jgi:hypothetical protein
VSIRDHRTGRNLVRTRNRQPDVVRKAGPHVKQSRYEPNVCQTCRGVGNHPDYPNLECWVCDGEGEY